MFKVGEKVVYPAHGVGVIESIQTKVISGTEKTFYMLRILDSDMTIMIPTENVAIGRAAPRHRQGHGRPRSTRSCARRRSRSTSRPGTGATGSTPRRSRPARVLEIAKVLRDLFVLKGDKELSFGERKMLDTARNLLVKELAIARSHPEEKIMEELKTIFAH